MPSDTRTDDQIMENLAALRGRRVTPDQNIGRYTPEDKVQRVLIPEGMDLVVADGVMHDAINSEQEYNTYARSYHHRPGDGAVAVNAVMHSIYAQFVGRKSWVKDPEMLSVDIGPNDLKKSVPWGACKLSASFGAKAAMYIDSTYDAVYGEVLSFRVSAIKRAEQAVEQIFDMVQQHLDEHSIYQGQAIYASSTPTFIDVEARSREVVFTERTARRLDFRLFSFIEKAHIYAIKGDDGKKIIWLYGDYGTGKSELLAKLTRIAVENAWTVIHVRPGVDNWDHAMQLCRMLAPNCLVIVEDAESITGVSNPIDVSKMLDQLDGVDAKTLTSTMFVFTTNYIDKIQKAATRWGRADAIIRLGNLDRQGCAELARLEIGDMLADDIDFDAVYMAMGGVEGGEAELTPAFMRQAFNTASMRAATQHGLHHKVDTQAILDGIDDLQEQLAIHRAAPEPKPVDTLSQSFITLLYPMVERLVAEALENYASTVYEQANRGADAAIEYRIHGAGIEIRNDDGDVIGDATIRTN